ncbi:MAG: hypothetical protein KDA80_06160, partial [Planctomycetaceae bacterium]|nr:hypothetical protein [Planctomycetaceae bacterium]
MLSHRLQDARCSLLVLAYWLMMTVPAFAQSVSEQIVKTPNESPSAQSGPGNSNRALMDAIVIETPYSTTFEEQGERVRILRGLSRIHQAGKTWTAPLAVIWEQFATDGGPNRVLVYLEGNFDSPVRFRGPVHQDTTHSALLELSTSSSVQIQGPNSLPVVPPTEDRFYKRAITRRLQGGESAGVATVQQAQYLPPSPVPSAPPLPEYQPPPLTPRFRRNVTISPRFLGDRLQWKGELSEASIPPEYVMTVTGGVNIVVDNVPLQVDGQTIVTRVDLTADRAILWTDASQSGNFSNFEIDETTPLQIYLEGNIVVRQGSNLVRASHAFYDINQRRGLLMNAEIRSFLSDYEGTLRLRAAELRQYSETNFHAKNAFFTTSEFGFPKYRVEASDVFVRQVPKLGPPTVNPNTG